MNDLCWLDATELARLVQEKKVSPREAMAGFLERISSLNPRLNAIVTLEEEETLLQQAALAEKKAAAGTFTGPLLGVPFLVKDNVYTRGMRTTMGSRLFEHYVPAEDAALVERLKGAGAILIGKSNLSEFGLLPVTDNVLFGSTQNPWDLHRTSGGSSGGSAAALAAGMVPLATGNDAGGSIRVPASYCGVYGIKPSFGRIPSHPKITGWETLVHEGPLTRSVADAALMLQILAGPDERDRLSLPYCRTDDLQVENGGVQGMKIACCVNLGYTHVHPDVTGAVLTAARVFEEMGAEVEELTLDLPDMLDLLQAMTVVAAVTAHEDRLEEWQRGCYPKIHSIFAQADNYTARDMVRLGRSKEVLWTRLKEIFAAYELLLLPTTPTAAFPFAPGGKIGPREIAGQKVRSLSSLEFTCPFNFTGQPAASVPCGFDPEGLPLGLQIVGRRFAERAVLRASAAFEEARPWKDHRPLAAGP